MQATLWAALLLMARQQVMLVAAQSLDNKPPCWVVCISNITQINGTVVGFTKSPVQAISTVMAWMI
jgi:hypothetical protein